MITAIRATLNVQNIGEITRQYPVEPSENKVKKRISSISVKSGDVG
jgi:hypothetical protein